MQELGTTWLDQGIVVLASAAVVLICVGLHYEALSWLTKTLRRIHIKPRPRILLLIFFILAVHVVEIWIFGVTYFLLLDDPARGSLLAAHDIGLLDCVYFSAVCFTTLGLGDVVPTGAIRFLVGTQSLTGFVLIAWSGSFTFVEMQRFWKD